MRYVWPAAVAAAVVCACTQPGRDARARPPESVAGIQGGPQVSLPSKAGVWTRPDAPRRIDARSIFDYMDGGGELYLSYRFDRLDVYEYTSSDQGSILVELYWMKSSDDALGLLSNDWGGEAIDLNGGSSAAAPSQVPSARALFGGGLLRLWSDNLYARVLAARDTPGSREQVIALGRAIVDGRSSPLPSSLVRALPLTVGQGWSLQPDRVCFLRSYLVLNSVYFLATDNILDLNQQVDAVAASYAGPPAAAGAKSGLAGSVRAVVAVYPSRDAAGSALEHFRRAYLPEARGPVPDASRPEALKVEDGWVADGQHDRTVIVALGCPDEATAARIVAEVAAGVTHEGGGR
jgi:hypothetical protein